jgi:pimeloyl-ACP methyl ester carboxylesterase
MTVHEPHSTYEQLYIKTNGITLHAMAAGPTDGPLVILLHGFPEFWYGWRRQIDPLAAAGYRVLVPDQRGYNLSDKPRELSAYCLDELTNDVIGLIDATGRKQAVLIGHDWGAAVTWWAAARDPQRFSRVAILNVPHPIAMRKHLRGSLRQLAKSWYMFAFQIPKFPEFMIRLRNWQAAVDGLETSRPGTFSKADLVEYRRAWSQPGAMTTMINWYRAMLRRPPKKLANPRITIPLLMIWGPEDAFVGRELAEMSLALCEQGRLEFIDGATHWVQHEEPARINELLLEFLAQDQPATSHA